MSDFVVHLVEQYGYFFFFLAFCLGPFGIPIPNEITIISGAILADAGILDPWSVYGCIFGGLSVAVTAAYWGGRILNAYVFNRLRHGKRSGRYVLVAENILKKHGNTALFFGYFIPVVRYAVPLIAGASGVTFRTFARYSYVGLIVWTVLFFTVGKLWGSEVVGFLQSLDAGALIVGVLWAAGLYMATRLILKHRKSCKKRAIEQDSSTASGHRG